MYRFWKWLFQLSERKFKQAHVDTRYNDIKCPNCKEWFSISGIKYKHKHDKHMFNDEFMGDACECGQCGYISYWSPWIAPCPVLVDEKGNPLTR